MPSGVSHYFDGRPSLSVPCGYQRGARFLCSCHVFNISSLALKGFGVRDGRAQCERGEIAAALPRHMEFRGCASHTSTRRRFCCFYLFFYFSESKALTLKARMQHPVSFFIALFLCKLQTAKRRHSNRVNKKERTFAKISSGPRPSVRLSERYRLVFSLSILLSSVPYSHFQLGSFSEPCNVSDVYGSPALSWMVVVGEGRLPKRVRLDSASMGMTLMAHPVGKSKPSAVGRLSSKLQFLK